jgi:VIT1/CCC1 family predicted Fe2+/Mn2+ transporter
MIDETPSDASAIVYEVFKPYRLSNTAVDNVVRSLHESASNMLDFLMRFHHQGAEPEKSRPLVCAVTISMGYFIGGLIPLIPYFFVKPNEVMLALYWSIGVMGIALFAFGWVKTGVVIGWRGRANMLAALKGALQMTMIGGVAAGASVGLVRAMHD